MSSLGTDGGGTARNAAYNTVSGDAVIVGPVLMAQHIEGIRLPAPPPDVPPRQGPLPSRVFVNRTQELADLRDAALSLAAGPEPGVVLVVGVGGVGKTQLVAQAVRRELHRSFPTAGSTSTWRTTAGTERSTSPRCSGSSCARCGSTRTTCPADSRNGRRSSVASPPGCTFW
ncbi:hypothetical protein ACIPRU_22705 [Streptomyces sp. NPDC090126]|uniref:hypothetical protein n=1 Tax=Streptomyces sp. NPDC090126 TaxID=3365952 RepID=UPI003830733D